MRSFISLGASVHQLPLILAAQRLGLKVVAVDINPGAVGVPFADYYVRSSIIVPPAELIALLDELKERENLEYTGCYSRSFGAVHATVVGVAGYYGLPYLPYFWTETTCDKILLRRYLGKHNIRQSNWYRVDESRILDGDNKEKSVAALFANGRRYVLKPSVGHGKQGVELIDDGDTLVKRLVEVHTPRRHTYLLEEFIDGPEITVLAWAYQGELIPILPITKHTKLTSPFLEVGHSVPSFVDDPDFFFSLASRLKLSWQDESVADIKVDPAKVKKAYEDLLHSVEAALTPDISGPLLIETKFEDGVFKVIELNFEVGGEYLADYLLQVAGGYGYFEDLVGLFSKDQIRPGANVVPNYGFIGFGFQDPTGKVSGEDILALHSGKAGDFYQPLKEYTGLPPRSNGDRNWVFGLKAASHEQLIADITAVGWDNWQSP